MKDRLIYWAFRVAAGLFGALPEPVARHTGRSVGYVWYLAAPAKRRMVAKHLRRVVGSEPARRDVREMFASYGRYWAEVFWIRPHRLEFLREHSVEVNLAGFMEAMSSGKGVIFVLAHLGNWEVSGTRATQESGRVLAVAEALSNRHILDWFIKIRTAMNFDVVIAEPGGSVTRALMRRLKDGGGIGLMSDRDIQGHGVPVEFFGEQTTLPAGPVVLSDRTGAPLIAIGTYFRDGPGHKFVVYPPIEIPDGGTAEERVAAGTQNMARTLETMIRAAPTQWHLFQPNWPSDREFQ